MPADRQLWLGYSDGGEKITLDVGGAGTKSLLLGSRAGELAALVALSAKEAGTNPVILDLGGSLSKTMSGHFDTYDYRSFLYDSFRLEEPGAWHSQLAAAAYAVALDLTSEEESIVNAAAQVVASDGTLLSPVSLHDVLGKVEGFRGFYVDRLSGRIGALRLFDAVEDQSFQRLVQGNVLVDFHSAPYPQAGELAAVLFLAKLVALSHCSGRTGGLLLMTDADRVFRASPRVTHSDRLLRQLLGWPRDVMFSSGQQFNLNPLLLHAFPVTIYSSDAWHSQQRPVPRVLSGSFVLHDRRSGSSRSFAPRRTPTKTADYAPARTGKYVSPELTRRILEMIESFPLSTPESIVAYVVQEFLPADADSALAALTRQGALILEPKNSGSGPKVFACTLTDRGRDLLKELGA